MFEARHSTKRDSVGRAFPQVRKLGSAAFSIRHDRLAGKGVRLADIELERSAKLSDCISTAGIRASGLLLSERAIELFQQFALGEHRVVPAFVHWRRREHRYGYLQIVNDMTFALNFRASTFCIRDVLGDRVRPYAVTGYGDFERKAARIYAGDLRGVDEYSTLSLERGVFKRRVDVPDFFTMKACGAQLLVTRRLKQAWTKHRLTGLEFPSSRQIHFA